MNDRAHSATPKDDAQRVDFYVLENACPDGRLRIACRLAETAFRHGHRVYIQAPDSAAANQLDQLLWTWSDQSFVPHAQAARADDATDWPVVIGHEKPDTTHTDILVTLLEEVPDWFSQFGRVMEAVGFDETEKASARQRFRAYREHGIEPAKHDIKMRA